MQGNNLSLVQLIGQASVFVQIVVVILIILSISSWVLIFTKRRQNKQNTFKNNNFAKAFWSGDNLNDLYLSAKSDLKQNGEDNISPIERLFISGMREYEKGQEKQIIDPSLLVTIVQRKMNVRLQKEIDNLENGMSFIGSVASSAPYIGLLGTVWGIMHAFIGFADLGQITLSTVAPGIAEALIATAIGLIAAIPAVLAFNYFNRRNERAIVQLESFCDDFINILQSNIAVK